MSELPKSITSLTIQGLLSDPSKLEQTSNDLDLSIEKVRREIQALDRDLKTLIITRRFIKSIVVPKHKMIPRATSINTRLASVAGEDGATLEDFVKHLGLLKSTAKVYLSDQRYGKLVLDCFYDNTGTRKWRKKPDVC
jgi:hypothetical protein